MPRRDFDEIDDGPLKPAERSGVRRMLQDYAYRRRFRTKVKEWVVSLGIVATLLVAAKTLLGEVVKGLLR